MSNEELKAEFEKWWEEFKPPIGPFTIDQIEGIKTCSQNAYYSGYVLLADKLKLTDKGD